MKRGFYLIALLGLFSAYFSCDNTETYAEKLKKQDKAIDRFIKSEGITVLDEYPSDSVFAEKEFVKLPSGIYMNVIDSGNGTRAKKGQSVSIRFKELIWFSKGDTTKYSNMTPTGQQPSTIEYQQNYGNIGSCEGFGIPLEYVGDRARVKLIIPGKYGFPEDQQSITPVYFGFLKYQFD